MSRKKDRLELIDKQINGLKSVIARSNVYPDTKEYAKTALALWKDIRKIVCGNITNEPKRRV